jgi:hypothetical protein
MCVRASLQLVAAFHLLAQAEGPHIGPYFLDVGQTFCFRPTLAHVSPAKRNLAIRKPDRVLFLVVDDDYVSSGVFLVIPVQTFLLALFLGLAVSH